MSLSGAIRLCPPPSPYPNPCRPISRKDPGSGGMAGLWGPLFPLPPFLSSSIHVARSSSQYPKRGSACRLYIYTVCCKSINTAVLSDVGPKGAPERRVAVGTERELKALQREQHCSATLRHVCTPCHHRDELLGLVITIYVTPMIVVRWCLLLDHVTHLD